MSMDGGSFAEELIIFLYAECYQEITMSPIRDGSTFTPNTDLMAVLNAFREWDGDLFTIERETDLTSFEHPVKGNSNRPVSVVGFWVSLTP